MDKKNIIAVILVLICGSLTLVAATGLVKIPVFSTVLGTDKPVNLLGNVDPNLYQDLLVREEVTLTGKTDQYCLTCDITYEDYGPMDVTLSSAELSSLLQATNNNLGPLKEIQVKLNDNNQAEMSAYADLKEHGYDFSGPLYIKGSIVKSESSGIAIEIQKVKTGLLPLPIPKEYIEKAENGINTLINMQLSKMSDLKIDQLEISDNALHFKGNYPKTASVN